MFSLKKAYSILCAVCLLTLPACANKPPLNVLPMEERKIILHAPAPSKKADDGIWTVADVDISDVQTDKKLISLTFDDAPTGHLESLIATFASFNEKNPDCKANATVFFNGYRIKEYSPTLLTEAMTIGFELGNHTYSHADLSKLDSERLRQEIDEVDKLLEQHDGKPRHLLRAPYGKTSEQVKSLAETPIIDWTVDTLDWTGVSAEQIKQTVLSEKFNGAIVLMHDGGKNTIEAVKLLLPALKEAGYQVVSVSQLSKAHNVSLKRGGTYIRIRPKTTGQG